MYYDPRDMGVVFVLDTKSQSLIPYHSENQHYLGMSWPEVFRKEDPGHLSRSVRCRSTATDAVSPPAKLSVGRRKYPRRKPPVLEQF